MSLLGSRGRRGPYAGRAPYFLEAEVKGWVTPDCGIPGRKGRVGYPL